jgi:hypothetical protein
MEDSIMANFSSLTKKGEVAQSINKDYTDQTTISTDSYVDIISIDFTPKYSNSKILVDVHISFGANDADNDWNANEPQFAIKKNDDYIGSAKDVSYTDGKCFMGYDASIGFGLNKNNARYWHSETHRILETSGGKAGDVITFKLQGRSNMNNSIYVNRVGYSTNAGAGVTSMRITEIIQ